MTVVIGPLVERGRRRLLVGVTAVYLPRGMTCELPLGTPRPGHVPRARGDPDGRDDQVLGSRVGSSQREPSLGASIEQARG
jgi:hypothetical protein